MPNDLLLRLDQAWATISRRLRQDLSAKANQRQLTRAQSFLLRLVREHPGQKISCAARKMGITLSAASVLVDALDQMGYITRRQSTDDRRVFLLDLTEQGQMALAEMEAERVRLLSRYSCDLTDAELEVLVGLLERIAKKVQLDERD